MVRKKIFLVLSTDLLFTENGTEPFDREWDSHLTRFFIIYQLARGGR